MGFFSFLVSRPTRINFYHLFFLLPHKDRLERRCVEEERKGKKKILSMSFLFLLFCADNYPTVILGVIREEHVYAAWIRLIP